MVIMNMDGSSVENPSTTVRGYSTVVGLDAQDKTKVLVITCTSKAMLAGLLSLIIDKGMESGSKHFYEFAQHLTDVFDTQPDLIDALDQMCNFIECDLVVPGE